MVGRMGCVTAVAVGVAAVFTTRAVAQSPVVTSPCVFWFQQAGYEFDLTLLQSSGPFIHGVDANQFRYAFCSNITDTICPDGTRAVSMLYTSSPGCLQSLGTLPSMAVALNQGNADRGLVVTVTGPRPCGGTGQLPMTTFTMTCDRSVAVQQVTNAVYQQNQCALQLFIATPAACPTPKRTVVTPLGGGWIAFIVIAVSLAVYLVVGSLYKRTKYGATGVEAIPNIDTWRRVGTAIASSCSCRKSGYTSTSSSTDAAAAGGEADGYYRSYDEI